MSNQEQEPITLSDLSDQQVDKHNRTNWLNKQHWDGQLLVAKAKRGRAEDALKQLNNGETGARRMIYDGSDIFQFKVPASMIDSVHRAVLEKKVQNATSQAEYYRDTNADYAKEFAGKYTEQLASIAEREMKASQEQADDEVA